MHPDYISVWGLSDSPDWWYSQKDNCDLHVNNYTGYTCCVSSCIGNLCPKRAAYSLSDKLKYLVVFSILKVHSQPRLLTPLSHIALMVLMVNIMLFMSVGGQSLMVHAPLRAFSPYITGFDIYLFFYTSLVYLIPAASPERCNFHMSVCLLPVHWSAYLLWCHSKPPGLFW